MTAPATAVPAVCLRISGDEADPEAFLNAAQRLLHCLPDRGQALSDGRTLKERLSDLALGSTGLAPLPKTGVSRFFDPYSETRAAAYRYAVRSRLRFGLS